MTLILRPMKNGVRFEHSDEDTETSVYIDKADTDEVMVRKLRRVIALTEGGQGTPWVEDAMASRLGPQPLAVVSTGQPPVGNGVPSPPSTNGWAAVYGPPKVPERLAGEVELVQPGEDA